MKYKTYFRSLALIGTLLLMTGCGLFSHQEKSDTPEQNWQQHQAKISTLDTWQVDGKVGIKAGKESGSATLAWLQQFNYYDIRLSGPMGRGATRIVGQKGNVSIEIAGQGKYSATTPEQLLQEQLGWNIPISNLVWWIKGLPAPETPYTYKLNAENQLQELKQDDWTIQYQKYQDNNGYWLPERIIAEGQDIRVTIVLKQWTLRKMGKEIAGS
ncbi:outer membrane lipoprotein LolB [Gammaproteobacteria bacterium ESL0073]|nr:outer membrane lipoprotein LolB [Gammaproteobacteria bacterium ESL0073]